MSGNTPAHMTANRVIASADRLMLVRHFCRNRNRIAEISVPAWPMPTQKTKLVMSKAQPTVRLRPQTPMPVRISYETVATPRTSSDDAAAQGPLQSEVGGLCI